MNIEKDLKKVILERDRRISTIIDRENFITFLNTLYGLSNIRFMNEKENYDLFSKISSKELILSILNDSLYATTITEKDDIFTHTILNHLITTNDNFITYCEIHYPKSFIDICSKTIKDEELKDRKPLLEIEIVESKEECRYININGNKYPRNTIKLYNIYSNYSTGFILVSPFYCGGSVLIDMDKNLQSLLFNNFTFMKDEYNVRFLLDAYNIDNTIQGKNRILYYKKEDKVEIIPYKEVNEIEIVYNIMFTNDEGE